MIRPYTSIAWLTLKALHIDCMAYSDDPVEKVIKDLDIDRALHIDCMAYSDDPVEKVIKDLDIDKTLHIDCMAYSEGLTHRLHGLF